MNILKLILIALICVAGVAKADVIDVSRSREGDLAVVAIGAIGPVETTAVLASGYAEGFLGKKFEFANLAITPFVGFEHIDGVGAKPRLRLTASGTTGPWSFLYVREAKGLTGKYEKIVASYTPAPIVTISAVRLNGKNGGRVDLHFGSWHPYVQITGGQTVVGAVAVF